jgi:hypothetical protein
MITCCLWNSSRTIEKELHILIVLGFYLSRCPTSLNCPFNLEGDWDRSILLEDDGLNIHYRN